MSYATQATAYIDIGFQQQISQALVAQALHVAAQPQIGDKHPLRARLAAEILIRSASPSLAAWATAVVADGVTLPGATDDAVLARIKDLWDIFAGA